MRVASMVLGILGGLAAALLAIKWLGDASAAKALVESAGSLGIDTSEFDGLVRAAYCMLGSLALGVAGGVMALKNKGKVGGALMAVGVVLPAIFAPQSLIATFLLAIGAILAFIAKPGGAGVGVPARA